MSTCLNSFSLIYPFLSTSYNLNACCSSIYKNCYYKCLGRMLMCVPASSWWAKFFLTSKLTSYDIWPLDDSILIDTHSLFLIIYISLTLILSYTSSNERGFGVLG